jgi:hypothetical protein
MTTKDKITSDFLGSLNECEEILFAMSFKSHSFYENGPSYFIKYKRKNTIVEVLFGPPEFEVEMIIFTAKDKFAFKDLLQIAAIVAWVNDNRYIETNGRNIKNELLWFIDLLKFSLPIIE